LLLERPPSGNPGSVLKAVKEQVRHNLRLGYEYLMLRYLSEDAKLTGDLAAMPQPNVSFNYLGRVERAFPLGSPFVSFHEVESESRAGSTPMRFGHEINALIAEDRLEMTWTYQPLDESRELVEDLVKRMQRALAVFAAHCSSPGAGGVTPSDFPAANLGQDDLDRLLEEWNKEFA
jgi:non-ribosomal peptide synthase protein (TIGR01720 family)